MHSKLRKKNLMSTNLVTAQPHVLHPWTSFFREMEKSVTPDALPP
jgi:hypothetical protein